MAMAERRFKRLGLARWCSNNSMVELDTDGRMYYPIVMSMLVTVRFEVANSKEKRLELMEGKLAGALFSVKV